MNTTVTDNPWKAVWRFQAWQKSIQQSICEATCPLLDAAGNVTGQAVDGFDVLAQQDSNGDGVVNSSDANFADLRVWQDLNQDGISQANELKTLDELGIAGINVGKTEHSKVLPGGNEIADLGTYTRTDGTTGGTGAASGLADVNLADDTFHREFTDHLDTSAVADLPDMQGSGAVRDLREAASQSPELASTLAQLGPNTTREQLKAAIGVILQQWADSANFNDSFETADAQNKDLFFIPPGVSALDAYNARYAGLLGAYSGINNGSPSGLSLTNDIQHKYENIRGQQDGIERLLKTLEAQIHIIQILGMLEKFNGMTFVNVEVQGVCTGANLFAEDGGQYPKQVANDEKWRIAA